MTMPVISPNGDYILKQYKTTLREVDDLNPHTIRGYLSDLWQFALWCEKNWSEGHEEEHVFTPTALTTPTITRYRAYLQTDIYLKPTTINRALITIKRYCRWLLTTPTAHVSRTTVPPTRIPTVTLQVVTTPLTGTNPLSPSLTLTPPAGTPPATPLSLTPTP